MTHQEFIEAIANAAIKYAPQYGICVVSPIIAQACLESAYGTSPKADYHNYFGLKYRKDRVTCHNGYFQAGSQEQNLDGTYVPTTTDWYSFDNLDSGVHGYFQFINVVNYSNLKGVTNPYEYLVNIKADNYATSIDYVKNVWAVVEKWNLTTYDEKLKGDKTMIKIGLDAGHGLHTAGKQTPDGIKEWTLNDKVRDKVVKILSDYECEIIHADNDEGETDESLSSRLNKYLNAGVNVFVSIHHNAYSGKWNNVTGVETYADNNATQNDLKLATAIQTRLAANTGLRNRGVKRCDFYVINQNKIPAVLVEGGFMDSTIDYPIITSWQGQDAYAKAVAEGLIEFLGLTKKQVTTTTPTVPTEQPKETTTSSDVIYKVQVGAFKSAANAEALQKELKAKGYNAVIVTVNNDTPQETKPVEKEETTFAIGDRVKIQKDAPIYGTGAQFSSWVYGYLMYVREVSGDRIVVSTNEHGAVTGPVHKKYLTKY